MKRHLNALLAALALTLAALSSRADIETGLVTYYNFEDLTGTAGEAVADRSGHGHDGICRQDQATLKAPTIVAGPTALGNALNFDGSFYVQIPNHADFNISDDITLAAWVSVDLLDQDWQTMFCRGDWSWRLHRSGSSDYAAVHMSGLANGNGADGQTTNIRTPKRWVHIVGTYKNGVGATLYINGVLESSNPAVSGLITTTGNDPVTIGAQINYGSLGRLWKGQMDEVRLYNRALTAADVTELYAFVIAGWNSMPVITCPSDQERNQAPATIQLTATVSDDGIPLPANPGAPEPNDSHKLRWGWTVVSAPPASAGVVWSGSPTNGEDFTYSGSSNAPGTVFTCNPTATFDVPGAYVLNFSASDGDKTASRQVNVLFNSAAAYHTQGYMYLSPVPEAEYCSAQTRFVLVRFNNVALSDVTNLLTSFITVTGAGSGSHPGTTHVASDGRTIIFTMSKDFSPNELVTVGLNPGLRPGAGGTVLPYQYRFMISTHLPDPGTITARGETPPTGSKGNAFDGLAGTKWVDLVVPNGSGNYSWIQYLYPGNETSVVNQYALTSASDSPERDPMDWNFYGVDQTTNLVLLDTQTTQAFGNRGQKQGYAITNAIAYRGYRLEITRVNDPAIADAVQLADVQLLERTGTILREYWTNIAGTAVTDLTGNANFPNNPSGSDQLPSFEAPINWAEDYGTRIRGYITAPSTGSFVFWIASDDGSELWLSTNANPANKVLIASVPGWTNPREWNKDSQQKSAAINLTAGQNYYIEALQKEGTGGDNVAVGWAKPGQPTNGPSEVIPGSVLSPWPGGSSIIAALSSGPGHVNSFVGASGAAASAKGPGTYAPRLTTKATIMPKGVSVPTGFPLINITTNDNPDPAYIFIDNRGGNGTPYNVIFDNSGSPVWYQLMPDERRDMKVQHNGMLTMLARTGGYRFVGLNTNYVEVASYWAVNGYGVDEHELQVLADGSYFLIGLASQTVDMSRYVLGGNPAASVTEQVIQGFTPAGELVFQWRAWDHLDVRDQQQFIDITASGFDFPHMNSIDVDTDGHILLSSRNTSESTKINRDTGEIIWRLGGAHSQFTFVNDPLNGPRNQHSVRVVATNRYTLFDNGNLHSPSVSRGVEYLLDPTNMTARVMWQYPTTPTTSLYSVYMGNAQRLANGNTLINWAVGNLPKLTEVRPDGSKAFEMNWADGFEAYRVWRCPWQGVALKPNLIIEAYSDKVTLIFNKFGDTNVAYYRIYGGTTPQPTNVLATTPLTMANLQSLQNQTQYYFRVTAVSATGTESAYSHEQSVFVNIVRPGQNMVANGDFFLGTNSWIWTNSGTASATLGIVSGAAYIHASSPGTALSDIQLRQAGLKLVQGSKYVLEFDAWASAPRSMEVRLGQNQSPGTTYKVVPPALTTMKQHFSYPFVMGNATDLNARIMFNLGVSTRDVYLDNVAVWMVAPGDLNLDRFVGFNDLSVFVGQWLRQGTGLTSDLNGDASVDFNDFKMMGDNWTGGAQ